MEIKVKIQTPFVLNPESETLKMNLTRRVWGPRADEPKTQTEGSRRPACGLKDPGALPPHTVPAAVAATGNHL